MSMEEIATLNNSEVMVELSPHARSDNRFLVANTDPIPYQVLKEKCTIPVFSKDNESTISHQEFVDDKIINVFEEIISINL